MRLIDGERAGATLQGYAGPVTAAGWRAPGLDVAALWRDVFAVEADGTPAAPRRSGDATRFPSMGRGSSDAASGGTVDVASSAVGKGVPWGRAIPVAAPALPERGPTTMRDGWTTAPMVSRDVAATSTSRAAGPDMPGLPVDIAQCATPAATRGPAFGPPVGTSDAVSESRAHGDEPSGHAGIDGQAARFPVPDPAASTSGARETVQVHCHDGAVSVTVRDTGLTPAEAIRCSLETAFTLRGERAALRRVHLNGRAVFERADAVGGGGGPLGRFCFAC